MDTERGEHDSLTAGVSMIDDGGETSGNNDPKDPKRGEAVESKLSKGRTDDDAPKSTIDTVPDVPDGDPEEASGDSTDPERTPCWDSQGSVITAFDNTLGPSTLSLPATGEGRRDIIPGFEILSELGRGGMGVVYKARELSLKRLVALKMIRDDWLGSTEHITRFEIEAEALARLKHPNILKIYEIGKARRAPFVALELLEGGSLKDRLAGNPQPVREAALLSTIARAVHAAHVAGILHRDLKPSNILFDDEGIPKIADFGLAKRLEVEDGETRTGQLIGSPSYMAPEQAKGWDREIGRAADIYSLGAILYEMLTGRPPFKGTTAEETIRLVRDEEPVPPRRLRPQLPFDLETICLKCIVRDPRKRYADALSLAEDLDRFLAGEPIRARRTPYWERGIKLARRHARKRPVTAIFLVMGIIAAGVAVEEVRRAQAQEGIRREREKNRIDGVAQMADQDLLEAQGALVQKRWEDARLIVSGVSTRIESEARDARFDMLRRKAGDIDEQARRGREEEKAIDEAKTRFGRFVEARDEALFFDSRFPGIDPATLVEAASRAARTGLGAFGHASAGDEWALLPLPAALSRKEHDEIKNGFYQLLLILADAVSQMSGAEREQRAQAALRILDQTAGVRSTATQAYHLRRADFLEMKRDGEGAAQEREEADRLAPADAVDLFLIGRESIRRSDWPGAITVLLAATQRQQDFFWADCLLAICYLQTHQPATARIGFSACLQRKPDRAWLYMLRGIANAEAARVDMGRRGPDQVKGASAQFEAAEADYRTALELLGDKARHAELHYVLLLNRGMMRLVREDLTAAAADFQEAIRLNDRRFEAFADLGQVYQRQVRTDDALTQFAKAIELRPNWAPLYRSRANVFLGLKDLSPELRDMTLSELEDAIDQVSAERRDAASRDLLDAIRYESPGNHLIAADWTKQAALFLEAERPDDALDACDAALEIVPRYAPAHELRIKVLLDLKQYDDLIRSCDVVLTWAKPSAKLYELRGIAKDAIDDFAGAIGDFTRSLDLSDEADRPRLRRYRGWSNLANEACRPAIQDFDLAIRLAPTNADAYLGRGLARARLGRYRDAEADAEMAVKHGDPSARFTFRVARIYSQAALAVSTEARSTRQNADRLVLRYQDLAVAFVRQAVKRTPVAQRSAFFHKTVLKDPAMDPIRRRLTSLASLIIDQPAPP